MKNAYSFIVFVFVLSSTCLTSQGQVLSSENNFVQMGVSQINITPDIPIPMSGYDARKVTFAGVHDSLYASALYFKGEKTSLLLITADLIGYNRIFIDETRNLISSRIGIPSENIMITAVHNHGGPVTKAYEKDVPEAVENYIKELQKKFVSIAVRASEKTVPFQIGIGKGSCDMNINRRAEFADGGIWLGRAPGKPCDHELDVVKFEDMENNTLAILINWPCHATTSGQENYEITGDWPGGAAKFIKKQTNKEIVVAITAGASGDINPIYGPGKDFNEIEAVGYHVGTAAWKTFCETSTFPVESLNMETSSIKLPGKKACKDQFPQKTYETGPDVEIHFTTFKIGNLILAGISGEVMNEIGLEVKKLSPYTGTVIITHCNGSSGYICTDKAFTEGGYEVKVTHLMPGAEKPLTNKLLQMINSL
jgi:neutral ceramidase